MFTGGIELASSLPMLAKKSLKAFAIDLLSISSTLTLIIFAGIWPVCGVMISLIPCHIFFYIATIIIEIIIVVVSFANP